VTDEALVQLNRVRVNRKPALVTLFADRIVLADPDGERVRPMSELRSSAVRRAIAKARLVLTFVDGEVWQVTGLRVPDASFAHRTLVRLARGG
jgi:hypothetical protein